MAAQATSEATAPAAAKRTRSSKSSNGTKGSRPMSQEHKDALAQGRKEGRIVNDYLDALHSHQPKRGRKVTPDTLRERLEATLAKITDSSGAERVKLIQDRMDLEEALRRAEDTTEVESLREAFVTVVKSYADRTGISYQAFREAGVEADVLKEAGLSR